MLPRSKQQVLFRLLGTITQVHANVYLKIRFNRLAEIALDFPFRFNDRMNCEFSAKFPRNTGQINRIVSLAGFLLSDILMLFENIATLPRNVSKKISIKIAFNQN